MQMNSCCQYEFLSILPSLIPTQGLNFASVCAAVNTEIGKADCIKIKRPVGRLTVELLFIHGRTQHPEFEPDFNFPQHAILVRMTSVPAYTCTPVCLQRVERRIIWSQLFLVPLLLTYKSVLYVFAKQQQQRLNNSPPRSGGLSPDKPGENVTRCSTHHVSHRYFVDTLLNLNADVIGLKEAQIHNKKNQRLSAAESWFQELPKLWLHSPMV
eukprot:3071485-Rhodomonas_salina.2